MSKKSNGTKRTKKKFLQNINKLQMTDIVHNLSRLHPFFTQAI